MRDVMVEVGRAAQAHELGFALVGAGLPLLPAMTGNAKSYAERGFEFREIGALGHVAAAAALEEPARRQKVAWHGDAVERVIELADGYPFCLQEYGRVAWKVRRDATITAADVVAAEPLARDFLDENSFSQRIGKLPIGEQRYMAAVAKLGEGPQETAGVAEVLRRRAAEVSGWRDRLIRAGLLYAPSRGKVAFTVPMCADYIRRTMPETRSSEEVLDEMREDRL